MRFSLFNSAVIGLALTVVGCFDKDAKTIELSGATMGTTYQVTVVEPPENVIEQEIDGRLKAELERLNSLISTYDAESELSGFNQQQSNDWYPVAEDTVSLITTAQRVSKATDGAYDVTMGSISTLWGFGAAGDAQGEQEMPDMNVILQLLNDIGYQLLQISADRQSIRKLAPGLMVDFSSIGKGYAVDRLGEILESVGVTRYLVEIGGEIRTRGLAADDDRWKIGIEWPVSGQSDVPTGIALENAHVATSGDYRNYKEVEGQRVSHLLDGRTGFPISHSLAAVTVLHGSTTRADAWATAFMVLGLEDAMTIAMEKGLAARFTAKAGDSFVVHTTPAFDAYSYKAK